MTAVKSVMIVTAAAEVAVLISLVVCGMLPVVARPARLVQSVGTSHDVPILH